MLGSYNLKINRKTATTNVYQTELPCSGLNSSLNLQFYLASKSSDLSGSLIQIKRLSYPIPNEHFPSLKTAKQYYILENKLKKKTIPTFGCISDSNRTE